MTTAITVLPPTTITADYLEKKQRLILDMFAKDCTQDEFTLLCHLAVRFQLDPFAKQIWAVKMPGKAAQIFAGRDGYLAVAIRSGVFDGMESGTKKDPDTDELIGWATVYRKDMKIPFHVEVDFKEYARIPTDISKKSLWREKPKTMIIKVAQAQALRLAFSISGMYAPEEMGDDDDAPPTMKAPMRKAPVTQAKPMKIVQDLAAEPVEAGPIEKCACLKWLTPKEIKDSEWAFPGQKHMCPACVVEVQRMKPKPAAPKAEPAPRLVTMDAENPKEERRDQPVSSPILASTIARINAEQEAADKQVKKPMPAIKPDPHTGIVSACQQCKKGITEAERNMSKQSLNLALCTDCLDQAFDDMKKPEAMA